MSDPIPLHPGQYYHIYNRGNNRENVFREERNYPYFLKLYAKYIEPIAETYAYCLLRNHFHFLVRIKDEKDLTGFENLSGLNLSGRVNPSPIYSTLTPAPSIKPISAPGPCFSARLVAFTLPPTLT